MQTTENNNEKKKKNFFSRTQKLCIDTCGFSTISFKERDKEGATARAWVRGNFFKYSQFTETFLHFCEL